MPLVQTRGAASAQGFGEFAQVTAANYIEDVFSCFLYTGNGATQTITNGIDLSTKGGLLWTKNRTSGYEHQLYNSAVGVNKYLVSNTTAANATTSGIAFNSNGFTLGSNDNSNATNDNGASWTFRKQPKFFDVVTYTGTGSARTVAHTLGATPGFVIVKRTDTTGDWYCGITVFGGSDYLVLNTTAARATDSSVWNNTAPTSTVFTVGTNAGVNANGGTYVAYLFANNAGGFGLAGTDSVISTPLVSSAGSGDTTVNLGFEPQFLMLKKTASTSDWFIYDTMRGMAYATGAATLKANTGVAETTGITVSPTATGFTAALDNSFTYFCLAIRRGPMKVPTSGTSVFSPNLSAATTGTVVTTNFPIDLHVQAYTLGPNSNFIDRLRGVSSTSTASGPYLQSASTAAEVTPGSTTQMFNNTGFQITAPFSGASTAYWNFQRAPSFMDVVCYTGGTGTPRVLNHNLAVAPELVITKIRNFAGEDWVVNYSNGSTIIGGYLNSTAAFSNSSTAPSTDITSLTSTTYTLNTSNRRVNGAYNYVAYLFATCAGVSKVGSYTGNGTTLQINCGFTAGARFVLIKKTSGTGSWYIWDSARGIVSGNDPYLLLNSTAAEVTNTDYIDTYSAGFEISSTAPSEINENGGSFIFLAIS